MWRKIEDLDRLFLHNQCCLPFKANVWLLLLQHLQADASRHIEEVAEDVNRLVQNVCQVCLMQQDGGQTLTTVARLLEVWRGYLAIARKGEKKSSLEELEMMKDQVGRLLETVMLARKISKKLEGTPGNV